LVNIVWLGLILFGIIAAAANGRIEAVTAAALNGAQTAVSTALGLIGILAFWCGVMKVAEAAGLVRILSMIVQPLIRLLFPSIPRNHPAFGAIVMNLSANVLGLSNAATPMGLIAMREMQKLNPRPDTASDAMCTFLALNTACITLIPATIIGIRTMYGSADPTAVVGTTILATALGMTAAVLADVLLRRLYRRRGGTSC